MILLPIPHAWTPPHPPSSSRPLPKLFIVVGAADTVRRMASSGGGLRVTDEIPEVEMEVVEPEPEEPAPVGSKRIRDSPNGTGSRGRSSLHGKRGTLPDFNTLRPSITSPGENLGSKIKRPTQKCTFYNQGRCNKGNGCTFLHEIEGSGSDFRWNNEKKAGVLAADAYGNSKGSGEGSQFKESDGLTKDKFLQSLVHVHGADKQSTLTPGVSHGMSSRFDDTLTKKLTTPRNELVPSPLGNRRRLNILKLMMGAETMLMGAAEGVEKQLMGWS